MATGVDLKFDFGSGPVKAGYTRVATTTSYTDSVGFGYEPSATVAVDGDATVGVGRFAFSAKVPEGNYTVTLTLGDAKVATTTTVEAEASRLMLERVQVPAGQVVQRSFTTNVRTLRLGKLLPNEVGREEVSLDPFDRSNARDWDDRLTIEFVGARTALRSMEIVAVSQAPTVFLAGDSTMTDRGSGGDVSWGQVLPRFFKPGVAIANNAQSGETLKSFANALRLDKMLSQMKKGDYLFIQFAHNDEKKDWPQTYVDAETTYKAYLRVYIAEARLRGATPVLVTPMDRGDRRTGAPMHSHGDYPKAVREVAAEEHVPLIDLYKMSIAFYDAAGADAPKILADGTHSTPYGGYEFARCIVEGIEQNKLGLAKYVVDDFKSFDPSHPDSAAALNLDGLFVKDESGAPAKSNPGPGPL
jgi:lysophospholipase L1-like esterase